MLRIPLAPAYRYWRRHDLLVILSDGDRIARARIALPRHVDGVSQTLARDACAGRVRVDLADGALQIAFAEGARGYLKVERTEPRLVIFDVETWCRIEDLAATPAVMTAPVEPVSVAQRASL
jgi:hypothetical protein